MRRPTAVLHFTVAASLLAFPASCLAAIPDLAWQALQPGVDYTVITSRTAGRGLGGDERLHVVRIDPGRAPLVAAMASAGDRKPRTAAEWCRERGLAVAINLGMSLGIDTLASYFRNSEQGTYASYIQGFRWARKAQHDARP